MRVDDLEILDLNEEDDNGVDDCVPKAEDFQQDGPTSVLVKKKKMEDDEEEIDWKKEIKSWIITLGITIALVLVLKNYVIINASVPTGSMENTIMPGDNLFGFRIAYMLEEPERGDIIFFYFPDDESQKYVKRIVGLPGETVLIEDGKIYINGSETPLEEPYLKEEWTRGTGRYEFEIPEECYLVLGDNRNESADARYWKNPYVTKEKIIGKAIFTYYPFDRWGFVE